MTPRCPSQRALPETPRYPCDLREKEARKQGSKEARKQGSKEARKQGSKEARKQGSKEARHSSPIVGRQAAGTDVRSGPGRMDMGTG